MNKDWNDFDAPVPTPKLREYVEHKRKIAQADAASKYDDEDRLRDELKPLWDGLSEEEQAFVASKAL